MKYTGKRILSIGYCVLGLTLFVLGCMELIDEFWSGMGAALLLIGVLQLIRLYRFFKDAAYREATETAAADERNLFLRNKAWTWAGSLFVVIASCLVIVWKIAGQELLSMAASYAVCLMLVLYWISFFVLRKKY